MSGTLRLRGSTSGYSELQAPAVAADQTFVLPTAGGTLLTTDSPVPKLTLELGSASQPSLTFQGDTDTGLFSEGTNTLNLVTGGSSKVVLGAAAHTIYAGTGATVRAIDIDSSGNIGVGTSSPQQVLHLASSAATTLLQFNDSGSGGTAAQVRIGSAGNDFVVLNNTASNTATERLRITSGGRVGIGTTSPDAAAKLVVSDGGEEGLEIRAGYNVGASEFIAYNRTSSTYIDLRYDAGHHAFKIAGSEKARIDSSGRLLVQSSSAPTQGLYSQYAPLTVQGYIGSTTGNGILNIARGTTASNLSSGSDIGTVVFSDSAGGEFGRISCFADAAPGSNDYPGRISFQTSADGSSSPTERMRIDSSGRLLVGTTTYTGNGQVAIAGNSSGSSAAGCLDIRPTLSRPTAANTTLSLIRFGAADHSNNTGYASINVSSDGASSSDADLPGRLEFHTTSDGASSPTERMRIDRDGNVGIGGTPTVFTGQNHLSIHSPGSSTNVAGIDLYVSGTRESGMISYPSIGESLRIFGNTARALTIHNNGSERMRIDSSGRVLIGTDTEGVGDASDLTIANSTRAGLTLRSASTEFGTIAFSDATSGTGEYDGVIGYEHTNQAMRFSTASAERVRIDSSGRLLVGTSSVLGNQTAAGLHVTAGRGAMIQGTAGASHQACYIWNTATSGNNIFVEFGTQTSITTRASIDYNRSAGQVRYNVTSDRRLKSNIQDSGSAISVVEQIKVRSYTWTETGYTVPYGFIAQELHEVAPDAVKVGDDQEEITDTWSVDNSKLVPLLTAALQEALAKIETLEQRLSDAGIV